MTEALKTIGVSTGIAGALIVALNLPWSGWGFVVFLVSSVSLLAVSIATKDRLYSLSLSRIIASQTGNCYK